MKVCFIGHKNIQKDDELEMLLEQTVIKLIKSGAKTFLFGSMSEFDDLSWGVVTKLRLQFPWIKRVYVRAVNQNIDVLYEKYLLESYEETFFPSKLEKAGRYSYVERNFEIIDNATYCIFYYNENYVPVGLRERKSGTKIAYNYAIKKKKKIINLYRDKIFCQKDWK